MMFVLQNFGQEQFHDTSSCGPVGSKLDPKAA